MRMDTSSATNGRLPARSLLPDARLPDWFRNNYAADKVARACSVWTYDGTCPDCGARCMMGNNGTLWACFDCGGGGEIGLSDSDCQKSICLTASKIV